MGCFFVTGTDTNVGKTVASRAIIQAMQKASTQIVGYKPLAYLDDDSIQQNVDSQVVYHPGVQVLIDSTNESVSYEQVNSYTFTQNYVPMMMQPSGERVDIEKLNQDLERLNAQYQSVLVEGCFGWLTPLNKTDSFADWVKARNMPVVLVVGIKEGCINHALLTAQSIQRMDVPLLGWLANRVNPGLGHYAEIIALLTEKINAPLLGEIPYIYQAEKQDLSGFITNVHRLNYMKTVL